MTEQTAIQAITLGQTYEIFDDHGTSLGYTTITFDELISTDPPTTETVSIAEATVLNRVKMEGVEQAIREIVHTMARIDNRTLKIDRVLERALRNPLVKRFLGPDV